MMKTDVNLRAAIRAVADACAVARSVQKDLERVRQITKDDRSPVTVADFAVQAIVAMELRESLGGDVRIVGEEHAGELRRDDQALLREAVVEAVRRHRPGVTADQVLDAIDACDHDGSAPAYWTLDPVDGTKGFLRGEQYAIALARLEHGRVTLGVLCGPNLSMNQSRPLDEADARGVIYSAAAGFGAWEVAADDHLGDPHRIVLLPRKPGAAARICESVEKSHSKQSDTQRIVEALGEPYEPARLDSQCKYAVVARGQADAYLRLPTSADYREKIWDHAAGMLVAAEAGAVVTDIAGRALDFTHGRTLKHNRGVVCAHPALHGRIIEAIESLGIGAAPAASPH
jgi:3'(2'), 5'-bisphosphate nucleotidase